MLNGYADLSTRICDNSDVDEQRLAFYDSGFPYGKPDEILDRRCVPLHTAHKALETEEPRKCERGETPPQVPEINNCSSVVGDKYRTSYGCAIRRPKRLQNILMSVEHFGSATPSIVSEASDAFTFEDGL